VSEGHLAVKFFFDTNFFIIGKVPRGSALWFLCETTLLSNRAQHCCVISSRAWQLKWRQAA